jgi:hypothetical protein
VSADEEATDDAGQLGDDAGQLGDDAGGESGGGSERLGGTANPPEADRSVSNPEDHPEQHAARQTGEGAEAEKQEETENELLDSEEHSDAEGPFGTG